jgi:hypothetical protein
MLRGTSPPRDWNRVMKFLLDTAALFSAAELVEATGADFETVKNWVRRGIITRAPIGGRQLRYRLFLTEEVYKTTLKNELVKLGMLPSPASEAVNEVWKEWNRKEILDGKNVFAIISTLGDKWRVLLFWQSTSGGPLFKLGTPSTSKADEIEFPKNAFAAIPITHVLARVEKKLADLLNGKKKRTAKNVRS